jgi:hypothetical protein
MCLLATSLYLHDAGETHEMLLSCPILCKPGRMPRLVSQISGMAQICSHDVSYLYCDVFIAEQQRDRGLLHRCGVSEAQLFDGCQGLCMQRFRQL